jgi:hypothetical protein
MTAVIFRSNGVFRCENIAQNAFRCALIVGALLSLSACGGIKYAYETRTAKLDSIPDPECVLRGARELGFSHAASGDNTEQLRNFLRVGPNVHFDGPGNYKYWVAFDDGFLGFPETMFFYDARNPEQQYFVSGVDIKDVDLEHVEAYIAKNCGVPEFPERLGVGRKIYETPPGYIGR